MCVCVCAVHLGGFHNSSVCGIQLQQPPLSARLTHFFLLPSILRSFLPSFLSLALSVLSSSFHPSDLFIFLNALNPPLPSSLSLSCNLGNCFSACHMFLVGSCFTVCLSLSMSTWFPADLSLPTVQTRSYAIHDLSVSCF